MPALALPFLTACSCFATEYTFTTLNYTYANGTTTETDLKGINDSGQIVGDYDSTSGFEYTNGKFVSLGIYAGGINNSGAIAGTGYGTNSQDIGEIINGTKVKTFTVPGSVRTLAYQINDSGVVAGYYTTSSGVSPNGYAYNGTSFKTISAPGAIFTFLSGFNNSGDAVGEYGTASNTLVQYFYNGSTFTSVSVPGSFFTEVRGVGNDGQIVGFFDNSSGIHGFVDQNGIFSTVDVPGASNTIVTGINDHGVIVGSYDVQEGTYEDGNGFVGIPVASAAAPEPSTLILLLAGLTVAVTWRKRSSTSLI